MVEAICRGEAPVLGSASVDSCAHFGRQHFPKLHTPLVKAVEAPNEPLHPFKFEVTAQYTVSRLSVKGVCGLPYTDGEHSRSTTKASVATQPL